MIKKSLNLAIVKDCHRNVSLEKQLDRDWIKQWRNFLTEKHTFSVRTTKEQPLLSCKRR